MAESQVGICLPVFWDQVGGIERKRSANACHTISYAIFSFCLYVNNCKIHLESCWWCLFGDCIRSLWKWCETGKKERSALRVSFPRHPNAHLSAPLTLGQEATVISRKFSNIKPTNDVSTGDDACWNYHLLHVLPLYTSYTTIYNINHSHPKKNGA